MNKDVLPFRGPLRCLGGAMLALVLGGCQSQSIRPPPAGPDDIPQRRMGLVYTVASVRAACDQQAWASTRRTRGCLTRAPDGTCWIVAVRPKNAEDRRPMPTIGHEFLHCRGRRHS